VPARGERSRSRPPLPTAALVAPDSFKGTLRATEVAAALGRGLESEGVLVDLCPVADGGEGTMEVLVTALGGETRGVEVTDPLGRPLRAGFALLEEGGTAIVEVAQASGLALVAERERDPERASSAGTGELIVAAAREGAQVVVVAAGGSATTDGGAGAIEAIRRAGGLGGAKLVVLCDVRTPFERAAIEFAPQKGADPQMVRRLTARLRRLARRLPRDPTGIAMTGAAGGLSGGLWAQFGARLEGGAAFVLDALGLDERMRTARAVVTGEGRLDETTLRGKAVAEVAIRARQAGVPAHAVVGHNALDPFDARILGLGGILEAGTTAQLERAGAKLARRL
jgi:glycerate kinase